ncbi:hypothetical protein GCM10010193_29060 [Kitasatospora atroaurantiaca]|uniref:ABC-2 type transport system permease protein n=1 Tax=Kitasatospora atroaurantiaca TaxID=285545 RepID=A0A561EIZ1_9ACTN|nr:ABC transporter permease [Kitasatospora atroaurantiaca]TWE15542.1 ABC-2 type transport system permease protein [Kitasatospora atroaurantiaca]
MSFADLGFRLGAACAFGGQEYVSVYSRKIILTSILPRAVLQAVFYVLLGQLLAGPGGMRRAFIGATGYALVTATVVRLADVLAVDKQEGTSYRLRTGALPRLTVALCRSWPYAAEALVSALAVLAVASVVVGQGGTALHLLRYLPLLALTALSLGAFGLAGAAASVGRRADVLVGNLLAAVLLAGCQVIAPTSIGWLDALGQVLPLRHALDAIRAGLDGGNPLPQAGWEAVVGLGWFAVAAVLLRIQSYRSARDGSDDHE